VERLLRRGFTWLSDGRQKEENGKDEKNEEAEGGAPHGGKVAALIGG
jgi:hypothetical protein